jgi:hypothetical protein
MIILEALSAATHRHWHGAAGRPATEFECWIANSVSQSRENSELEQHPWHLNRPRRAFTGKFHFQVGSLQPTGRHDARLTLRLLLQVGHCSAGQLAGWMFWNKQPRPKSCTIIKSSCHYFLFSFFSIHFHNLSLFTTIDH